MGILGSGGGVGLRRARSQPERLLVLGFYLLQRGVRIFMRDVKVQRLSLQASVDVPVNRAHDRCEPGTGSVRQEHPQGERPLRLAQPTLALSQVLPSLGRRCLVPQPVGHLLEGIARREDCAPLAHAFSIPCSSERDFCEPSEAAEAVRVLQAHTCPASPLSCVVPSLLWSI